MKVLMGNKTVLLALLLGYVVSASAQWTNLNSGINDNLNGVVIYNSRGIASGPGGLYYTLTGGAGPGSWTRYQVRGNAADSVVYSHTKFTHCYKSGAIANNLIYACGRDTVANKGIVMRIDTNLSYTIAYTGPVGSSFAHIGFSPSSFAYYAVGSNGLIVSFSNTTATVINAGLTDDLRSISFSTTYVSLVGAHTIYSGTVAGTIFTLQSEATPSNTYRDVIATNYMRGVAVGSTHTLYLSGFPSAEDANYDFGPLNASSLANCMNYHFVGTDHGIFRTSTAHTFLEYEPSSLNYKINAIWSYSTSAPPLYACGENGTILMSNTIAATKPLALINMTGGCVNTAVSFNASTGSSTSCKWYINNTLYQSQCSGVTHTFPATGAYTIRLETKNDSLLMDTTTRVINIVNVPSATLPVRLNKYVLCHQEPVTITVDSTQLNVYYSLLRYGSTISLGQSTIGTGGTISFTAGPLTTGIYHVRSNSYLAQCTADYRDTLRITDEQTKADFYVGRTNATPGEKVPYYQHCQDASHYRWSFTPAATTTNIDSPTAYAAFAAPAHTQARLICWSDHGCYDTLTRAGATIAAEPNDPCWTMVNTGPNIGFQGFYTPDVHNIAPSRSGFLACGHFNHGAFASRSGDSLIPSKITADGGYFAKYSSEGMLKWMGMTQGDYPLLINRELNSIKAVAEDRTGNIYICGQARYIMDNKGDSFNVTSYNNYGGGFIAKCDSDGRMIWSIDFNQTTMDLIPQNLTVDYQNNVIVSMENYQYNSNIPIKLNGVIRDSVYNRQGSNHIFLKLDPTGHKIWENGIELASGNSPYLNKVTVDTANNMYVSGAYTYQIDLYSAGSTTPAGTMIGGHSGGTPDVQDLYLAKYNKNGILQWKTQSYTTGPPNTSTGATSLFTDSVGNCYITGYNECDSTGGVQVFQNSDSTTVSYTQGRYFAGRIDANGKCKWLVGNSGSYYGGGIGVTKSGSEISVLGHIGAYQVDSITNTLKGTNGAGIPFTMDQYDFFIATYDTAGKIKRVILNGRNGENARWGEHIGFFSSRQGNYYLSRNLYRNTGTGPYSDYGTYLPITDNYDGSLTKVTPGSCGIIYAPNTTTVVVSACPHTLYTYHGHQYSVPGQYLDTLHSSTGADSLVEIDLIALPASVRHLADTICSGQSVSFAGILRTATGLYADTTSLASGCDSITTLSLTVLPVIRDTLVRSICHGHSYLFDGLPRTTTGTYRDTLSSAAGCDSIVVLRLTELPVHHDTIHATICTGMGYTFDGHTLTAAGTYSDTVTASSGCDSMVTLLLSLTPIARDTAHATICAGGSYTFHGQVLTQTGTYTDTAQNGCDTIITLHLLVAAPPARPVITQNGYTLTTTAVSGIHYQWQLNGNNVSGDTLSSITATQNGSYAVTARDSNNCVSISDTVHIINVSVEDVAWADKVTISPNPASEGFIISFSNAASDAYTLELYDLTGRVVMHRDISAQQSRIDRGTLTAGTYIIKLINKQTLAAHQLRLIFE